MHNHDWVAEVLSDLEIYIQAHDAKASQAAIDFARYITTQELGLSGAPHRSQRVCKKEHPGEDVNAMCRFRLVVDNSDTDST